MKYTAVHITEALAVLAVITLLILEKV